MSVTTERFGDSPANLFWVRNANDCVLVLSDLGASVVNFRIPKQDGEVLDVVLGYDSYEGYINGSAYMGATVGRYANRIANGRFRLNGESYDLDKNQNNRHTLHGGGDSYHTRIWKTTAVNSIANAVTFSLHSPDGDQGFPGNADISVTYTLNDSDEIVIRYDAVSDKETVFNLTNHSYFNLDGRDSGDISSHQLWISADYFTPIDEELIPTGQIVSVKGTPLDFTNPKRIGREVDSAYEQMAFGSGYDHNFVLKEHRSDSHVARVLSEKSGIEMLVYTDMPGLQFYSGNGLGSDADAKNGSAYAKRGGFCLETQFFPDSPNQRGFPSPIYESGRHFESFTTYSYKIPSR
jgi:aldose 1-epimerase